MFHIGIKVQKLVLGAGLKIREFFEVRRPYHRHVHLPYGLTLLLILAFTSSAGAQTAAGVCERTTQVRDGIVAALGSGDCNGITGTQLTTITSLELADYDITALQAGDFAGLGELTFLNLNDNDLTVLPAGVFDELSALTMLGLSDNDLTGLPAGVFDELGELAELNLDGNDLTGLPVGVFAGLSKLTVLDLEGNDLTGLPAGVFAGLSKLTFLDLDGNALTVLPAGVFEDLGKLTFLNLGANDLTVLSEGVFGELGELAELYLNSNDLTVLPADVFAGLSELTELDLGFNDLTELPAGVFEDLGKLIELNLGFNDLTGLPADVFDGLGALVALSLTFNALTELPAGVFDELFDTLSSLTAANSALPLNAELRVTGATSVVEGRTYTATFHLPGTLPFAVRAPYTVTLAGASAADFTTPAANAACSAAGDGAVTIPAGQTSTTLSLCLAADAAAESGETITLTLDGSGLALQGIGGEELGVHFPVASFATLGVSPGASSVTVALNDGADVCGRTEEVGDVLVDVTGNDDCSEVTGEQLAVVTSLDLSDYDITALQAGDFAGLGALTVLNLSANRLTELPANVFDDPSALTELNLSNNALTGLPANVFDNLSALTKLNLGFNDLTELPAGVFDDLGELTSLYLHGNDLTGLPAGVFDDLGELITLDLSGNDLTGLSADVFAGLGKLQGLFLVGNALTGLPAGVFAGLGELLALGLGDNALSELPAGVFDELFDTLNSLATTNSPLPLNAELRVTGATSVVEGRTYTATFRLPGTLPFAVLAPYTVTLTGASAADFTTPAVDAACAAAENGAVTIAAGQTTATLSLCLATDAAAESGETITLTLDGNGLAPRGTGGEEPGAGFPVASLATLGVSLGASSVTVALHDTDLCERTKQVSDVLVDVTGSDDCSEVTGEQLAAITSLDLSDYGITALQAGDLAGLGELTFLTLHSNGLTELPASVFDDLGALNWLDLGGNGLTELPADVFAGLGELQALNLNDNALTELPAGVFAGLGELQVLFLASNALTGLPADVFAGLSKLLGLGLANNALTGLPAGVFDELFDTLSDLGATNSALPLNAELRVTGATSVAEGQTYTATFRLPGTLPFAVRAPYTVTLAGASAADFITPAVNAACTAAGDGAVTIAAGQTTATLSLCLATDAAAESGETITLTLDGSGLALRGTGGEEPGASFPVANLATLGVSPGASSVTVALHDTDLCERTKRLSDAIVDVLDSGDCNGVTKEQLAAITSLDLSDRSITALQAGDFADLSALTALDLSSNHLAELPADVFADLSAPTSLDLGDNDLTGLPAGVFADLGELTFLSLSGNGLTELPEHVFADLGALIWLDLNDNALTELSADVFAGLGELRGLFLGGNALTRLPAGVFAGLGKLLGLSLGDNALTGLPAGVFAGLGELIVLDLGNNALTELPAGVFDELFDTLSSLIVANSSLPLNAELSVTGATSVVEGRTYTATFRLPGTLPFAVRAPYTVTLGTASAADFITPAANAACAAAENGVVTIPAGETEVTLVLCLAADAAAESGETIVLTLDGSGLALRGTGGEEPGASFPVASLATLGVSLGASSVTVALNDTDVCERTREVGDAIVDAIGNADCNGITRAQLAAITSLDLSDQSVTALQAGDFAGLGGLTFLNLYKNSRNRNPLTELPEGVFAGLGALTNLNLGDNALTLTGLPADVFAELGALTELNLGDNALTGLPAGVFTGLGELTVLYLYGNDLTGLPEGVFAGLGELTLLDLNANDLTELPANLFADLGELTELYLGFNELTGLPAGVFDDLSELTRLSLSFNNLTELPAGVFDGLFDTLEILDRSSSPLPLNAELRVTGATSVVEGQTYTATFRLPGTLPFTVLAPYTVTLAGASAADFITPAAGAACAAAENGVVTIPAGQTTTSLSLCLAADAAAESGETITLTLDGDGLALRGAGGEQPNAGFPVASLATLAVSPGASSVTVALDDSAKVCERTAQVRDAIMVALGNGDCNGVGRMRLTAITSLDLSDQSITALQAGDFAGLGELTFLSLDENALTELPAGVFADPRALIMLSLKDNALTELPADVFAGLGALIGLDLSGNALTELPADVFAGLSALVGLLLNDNALTALPAGVFAGLGELIGLNLGDNDLTGLPAGVFADLGNLEGLNLDDNALTGLLPAGLFDTLFGTLNVLDAANSSLPLNAELSVTGATSAVEGQTYTATFSLPGTLPFTMLVPYTVTLAGASAADFTTPAADAACAAAGAGPVTIPAGETEAALVLCLAVDTAVEHGETITLTLDGDGLAPRGTSGEQPNARFPLARLARLGVSPGASSVTVALDDSAKVCERTAQVRDAIVAALGNGDCNGVVRTQLAAITSLDLSDRSITALQAGDFAGLGELTFLNLGDNALTGLPAGVFAGLGELTELYLHGNDLTGLAAGVFAGLGKLTVLDLNANALPELPAGVFAGLGELTELYLGSNDLTGLAAGVFADLGKLIRLSLSFDDLTDLPAGVFDALFGTLEILNRVATPLPLSAEVGVTGAVSAVEGQTYTATFRLSGTLPFAVWAPYTVTLAGASAADFTTSAAGAACAAAGNGAVIIPAGQTTTTLSLCPATDAAAESGETITLTLDGNGLAPRGADGEAPNASFPVTDLATLAVKAERHSVAVTLYDPLEFDIVELALTFTATAAAHYTLPPPDGGIAPLTFSLTPGAGVVRPGWLAFDPGTAVINGTPDTAVGALAFLYTATDSSGVESAPVNVAVSVAAVPSFGGATVVAGQSYTRGKAITALTLPTASDGHGELSYHVSDYDGLTGLTYAVSGGAHTLTGMPTSNPAAPHDVVWTAIDGNGASGSLTFAVTVFAAPAFSFQQTGLIFTARDRIIPNLTLPVANAGTPPLAYGLHGLVNANEVSVPTAVPGLGFDGRPATRELSGTPEAASAEPVVMVYTATDRNGAEAVQTFSITVIEDETPPSVTYPTPAELMVGVPVALAPITEDTDVVSYEVTAGALPANLVLDARDGRIAGAPTRATASPVTATLIVRDNDGNGASVNLDFPAVAKGEQVLNGFGYLPLLTTVGGEVAVVPPTGIVVGALSYDVADASICTVGGSGALTLWTAGDCVVTVTAAATDDYQGASASRIVQVVAAPTSLTFSSTALQTAVESALGKSAGEAVTDVELATLTRLSLANLSIGDLAGMQNAVGLTHLELSGNNLDGADLTFLAGLIELTRLELADNAIADVGHLGELTNLAHLDLADNEIETITALVANAGLAAGDTVDLRGNPLTHDAITVSLAKLLNRGVRVLSDVPTIALGFSRSGDIDPAAEHHYYRLTLEIATTVKLRLTPPANLTYQLILYTPGESTAVATATISAGGAVTTREQILAAGTYFLRIAGDGINTGSYSVGLRDVNFVPVPPPRRQPSSNTAPQPVGGLARQRLDVGGAVAVNVAGAFQDADGDPLAYAVSSSSRAVATVRLAGSVINVRGAAPGTAMITVTARDPDGAWATQEFAVAVGTIIAMSPVAVRAPEGGVARFSVTLSDPLDAAITVNYRFGADSDRATANADASDYGASDGAFVIAAGETTASLVIPITDDVDIEPVEEVFAVTLSVLPGTGAAGYSLSAATATVTIAEGVCDRSSVVRRAVYRPADCTRATAADLASVRALSLTGRNLTALRPGDLDGLVNLSALFLNRNQLGELPAGLFADLGELTVLDLSANRLTRLAADSVATTAKLRRLSLHDNRLAALPAGLLAGLADLESLRAAGNRLTALPTGLFRGVSKLTRLQLRDNPGAPFELVVGLTRVDAAVSAPGPATVVATAVLGAPFPLTTGLTAVNGSLSGRRLTLAAGRVTSAAWVLVTALSDDPAALTFEVPRLPDDYCLDNGARQPCFDGLIPVARPLILFTEPPTALPIPDTRLPAEDGARLALADYFTPFAGKSLRYTATSSDPALATVRVAGGMLIILANDNGEEGTLRVTVTAIDSDGASTTTTITVFIEAAIGGGMLRGWRMPWLAGVLKAR